MEEQSIWSAVITLVTVLGGTSAWRFYEKRALKREKDEDFIRHDCKDRISKLEALLENSSKEKDEINHLCVYNKNFKKYSIVIKN